MVRAALILGLTLVAAAVPRASRGDDVCPARLDDWTVIRGTIQAGRGCGRYVLATDAAAARFSSVEVTWRAEVTLPYQARVSWRRLGPEGGRSLSVVILGAVVLIKDGAVALYPWDEAAFAAHGWEPVDGLRTHDEHAVEVTQTSTEVVVRLDGAVVASWALAVSNARGRVGLAAKGASGHRSKVSIRDFAVAPLP